MIFDQKLIEYQNPYWKNNPKNFHELIDLIHKFSNNGTYIKKLNANGRKRDPNDIPKYKYLRLWIENVTAQYNDKIYDIASRIYWILNGLTDSPKCANEKCTNRLHNKKFNVTHKNQPMFCSIYCLNTSKSHTINANTTKAKHSKEYWKLIEQKKKNNKNKKWT